MSDQDGQINQIGADVGGTFTDVFLITADGRLIVHKVPSTPHDPSIATLDGMKGACEKALLSLGDMEMIFHASTVATNAVLERSGAEVGLITTEGFRDILHIGRHRRPLNFSLYQELPWQKWPLVPRRLRLAVSERVTAPTGEVAQPLDEAGARAAVQRLKHEGVDAVAVCFLHSYLNPEHEERIGVILAEEFPEAFVSLRHVVCPEYREYEAFNTVAMNAYVGPSTGEYVARLSNRLRGEGAAADVLFMTSSGGVESTESVSKKPVNMLLSGPVAGVIGGLETGRASGFENLITLDVGGTSADIGVIHEGRLRHKHWLDNEIGGFALRLSMIDVSTIGAGGGSIAYIDRGAMLQVGPRSAGADPGPACYGRGGEEPTVTDAELVLGRLRADAFLGGRMEVSSEKAREAISRKIAQPLGLTVEEAAAGIVRIATSHMVDAIELNSVRRGYDPREFALVAFGGAGPLFASHIGRELQIPHIVVPRFPGIGSAMGLLGTDVIHDYRVSIVGRLDKVSLTDLAARVAAMEREANSQLKADGFADQDAAVERYVECRYVGQGYELRIPAPLGDVADAWISEVANRFHQAHEREYAHSRLDTAIELVNLGVQGVGRLAVASPPLLETASGSAKAAGAREVWFEESASLVPTAVYKRDALRAGHEIGGPAIIEQEDSTVVVAPGSVGIVDRYGNITIARHTGLEPALEGASKEVAA